MMWSLMGVFDRGSGEFHLGKQQTRPYVCMACEVALEVQYHSCPSCGAYDIRRAKWVRE